MKSHTESTELPDIMAESPVKHKPTSRVIDSLHSEIDALKTELADLRMSNSENRKKASLLTTKNESLVDQLANCKHENDMINALLKRKERRIVDLEEQYNDLSSLNDSLKLSTKNLKIRCDNLQELSASSTAEYERLKIAYDAMIASQNEYKRHYLSELNKLQLLFDGYKANSQKELAELAEKLTSNDKDVDTLVDSLTNKRKVMDNLYVNRNKAVLDLLAMLAKTAKLHGEESRAVLKENVETINLIRTTFPDLQDKMEERQPFTVDLDEIMGESAASLDTSLAELEQPIDEAPKSVQRNASTRRRRHKRQSMRISPEPSAMLEESVADILPKLRPTRAPTNEPVSQQHNTPGRNSTQRQSSSAGSNQSGNNRSSHKNRNSQIFPQDSTRGLRTTSNSLTSSAGSGKNKRRLFYGGSNNFNSGNSDRKSLGKAEF